MSEKIIGYILLTLGVIIIAVSGIKIYNVLVQKAAPTHFISYQKIVGPGEVKSSEPNIAEAFGLDPTSIDYFINLSIYLLLFGFLAKIGWHLGSLGVMLLRPVVWDAKIKTAPAKK